MSEAWLLGRCDDVALNLKSLRRGSMIVIALGYGPKTMYDIYFNGNPRLCCLRHYKKQSATRSDY